MRGTGGKQRTLVNEEEIVNALMRRGVVIMQAETLSVPELIMELFGARIIISVEGSQLSHALFTLREEGGVLAIQPPDRFFNSHRDWVYALNMHYGIVVGEQRKLGFYLPTDDLLRTIDLMNAQLP
jgi:capsular polysaccharide biosynthesis protein